jgi:hypothetical protein
MQNGINLQHTVDIRKSEGRNISGMLFSVLGKQKGSLVEGIPVAYHL